MNAGTRTLSVPGAVGVLDTALDVPSGPATGIALIAHPHPLHSGTRDNKVVQTLARALVSCGYACWRPNFRGVGGSGGQYDEGRGEVDDILAVLEAARSDASAPADANAPLVLAGFSFGAFVQTHVAARLAQQGQAPHKLILVAPAVSRFACEAVPADTLVIHGELDDTVPLSAVFDWIRPQELPVVVIPGADHFFHRRLPTIRRLVSEAIGPAGR